MNIKELLDLKKETEFLDYKYKIDFTQKKVDFLRDIIAFSNNSYIGDQFIVYGIKETPEGINVVGLDNFDYGDDAEYHELIAEKVEPYIDVQFIKEYYQNHRLLIVRIRADKDFRPFMVKNRYSQNNSILEVGEAWIRVGSSKKKMIRSDFENIYLRRRGPIDLKLLDNYLFVSDSGIAHIDLLIANPSDFDRVFTTAFLSIDDVVGNQLTVLRMLKFTSKGVVQEGSFYSDFSLSIPRKSEIHGVAEFSFSSTQAIVIGLSEYGDSNQKYIFRIKLRFDIDREYLYSFNDCTVFAKGKVLWKVQDIARENRKKKN